jgi:hypothetical protein
VSGAEPAFGKPTALFADEYDFGQEFRSRTTMSLETSPIMLRRGTGGQFRVVVHWTEELKRILAAGGSE